MTDRLDSLKALREKVRAGDDMFSSDLPIDHEKNWPLFYKAFHGSLDASAALHNAVLPGLTVRLCAFTPHGKSAPHVHIFRMRETEDDPVISGNSSGYDGDDLARAWLIAILSALISIEEGKA